MYKNEKGNLQFCKTFFCRRCLDIVDGTEKPVEVLCGEVETVKEFCYLGDRLNTNGG